jgi:gamma-glutamylcyclotransferase
MSTVYFGYGSNLWLDQMNRRCPHNRYLGMAILRDWKWIINTSGYANVIPSPGDVVYGMLYLLTPEDEYALDGFEFKPTVATYVKKMLEVETMEGKLVESLVYVDVAQLNVGEPWPEYVNRMNRGIDDALRKGMPQDYVDTYLRPFIKL